MSTKQLLVIDTRDDRRELHYLLSKLSPNDRIAFLTWACQQAPQGTGRLPVPCVQMMATTIEQAYRCDRADTRLTNEVYCDLLSLLNNFDVDAVKVTLELEQWLKRPDHRRSATRALSASPPASRRAAFSRSSCTGSSTRPC